MNKSSTTVRLSLLATLVFGSLPPLAAQTPTVSPADRATLEGATFTHFPLGRFDCRMQTLHADVPGGTVIAGHGYRRDAAGLYGDSPAFVSELEVTISMSPNAPDQAAGTFASNVGSNPVVVLPRTPISFQANTRPAIDPAPQFDFLVPYQTPFVVPAGGGTVCVDVTVYGNSVGGAQDQNFSVYLDGHRTNSNGEAEQPGYRFGQGCPAPNATSPTTANATLWHIGTGMEIDLSVRNGIPEDGTGLTRAWLGLSTRPGTNPTWPSLPACTLYSTHDAWYAMPGTMTTAGRYDAMLQNLPVLPAGYRLWLQAGTAHLGTGDLTFSNGITIVTQPPGPTPIPTMRIVNSSNRAAASGSVSTSVPVTLFF